MGLLSASAYAPGGGMPMNPRFTPQPPMAQAPMGGGLAAQFSQNPQFQQQLMALMGGQGPGMQQPQFTPPPVQVGMGPSAGADLWHDGIDGNARAAGLKKPGGGRGVNLGAGLLGGALFGGM